MSVQLRERFKEKVVLITGGSSGIGLEVAKQMSSEGASRIVISGRNSTKGLEAKKIIEGNGCNDVQFVEGDVAQYNDVAEMVRVAIQGTHGLNYAINNASIIGGLKSIVETTIEEWDSVVGINLRGVFNCLKLEALHMSNGGSIVNVGSINSFIGCEGAAAYVASKHGLLGLTKCAAAEFAPKIRVNAICPGIVDTPMHQEILSKTDGTEFDEFVNSRTILKRKSSPDEIATAILWLCSSEASYITGTSLVVDGGLLAI